MVSRGSSLSWRTEEERRGEVKVEAMLDAYRGVSRPGGPPRVVMMLSTSPSYVGESMPPSSDETTVAARAWRGRAPIDFELRAAREEGEGRGWDGAERWTETAEAASSVRGSLSSSEAS